MKAERKSPPKPDPKPTTILAFKASPELADKLDRAVKAADTDRSKFIRNAVRKALSHIA
jgi:predicted transcriptional regulator